MLYNFLSLFFFFAFHPPTNCHDPHHSWPIFGTKVLCLHLGPSQPLLMDHRILSYHSLSIQNLKHLLPLTHWSKSKRWGIINSLTYAEVRGWSRASEYSYRTELLWHKGMILKLGCIYKIKNVQLWVNKIWILYNCKLMIIRLPHLYLFTDWLWDIHSRKEKANQYI